MTTAILAAATYALFAVYVTGFVAVMWKGWRDAA